VKGPWVILAAGALLASAAAAQSHKGPVSGDKGNPGNGINVYSLEREVEMGRKMATDVMRQARLLDDPVVVEYVNRLSQLLVRNSDARVPFTVRVIDSREVNAFALPGGFLFVNTGMLLRTETEAELAGVLAHEIAHVAARHGTKQATRKELVNYASMPLVLAGGWFGYTLRELLGIAVPMGFNQFTRGMERQADTLGLDYLYRSGYDPLAFVDFFERMGSLEKTRPGLVSRMFSSHPMTSSRIKAAQKQIQRHMQPRPTYVVNTSEFDNIRARLVERDDVSVPRRRDDGPFLHRRHGGPAIDDTADATAPEPAHN
jgi:predicted Zn-dependent protease